MNIRIGAALGVFLLSGCVGCGTSGSTAPGVAVHGDVTFDGKPLEAAVIAFHCGQGEDEVIAFGVVEHGKYEIPADKGPLVGTARVEFQPRPLPEGAIDAAMDEAARRRSVPKLVVMEIPPRYGPGSTLTAEVKADGENKFDFELTSRR
jgi:hypothetical protein